jgi:hypothetical protein
MKISELPQEIKEKALEYQRNANPNTFDLQSDCLLTSFSWMITKEGHNFWKKWYSERPNETPGLKQQLIELRKQFPNDLEFGAEVAKLLNYGSN